MQDNSIIKKKRSKTAKPMSIAIEKRNEIVSRILPTF